MSELLYDPAPRRRGGRRRSRAVRHYRSYDPAAKKRKVTARRTKKGFLNKLKPYVLPGTAGVTFYAAYVARATELFNAGSITANDVVLAIQYDIQHFVAGDAMTRLQTNAISIATPAVGGFLVDATHIAGKYSPVVRDLLYGLAVGTGAKAVLDPPIPGNAPTSRRIQPGNKTQIRVQPGGGQADQPAMQPRREYNPYMPGGGY